MMAGVTRYHLERAKCVVERGPLPKGFPIGVMEHL